MNLPVPASIEHKGKTYRVPPLGLSELLEHAKWLRDSYMAEANRQMVGLPVEIAKQTWIVARQEADAIRLGSKEYRDVVFHYESLIYALWLSLKEQTVGMETIKAMFAEDLNNITNITCEALGYVQPDPTKPAEPAQNTNQKQ